MPSTEVTRHVDAPPEAVWAVLTDLDRAERVIRGIVRLERLAGPAYGVGTRWRETRRMMGREGTEEMEVTAVEPPHRTVVEAESGGMHYATTFTLEPDGGGTRLTMAFAADPARPSLLLRVLTATAGRLAARATRKVCEQDLADIAAAAQAR